MQSPPRKVARKSLLFDSPVNYTNVSVPCFEAILEKSKLAIPGIDFVIYDDCMDDTDRVSTFTKF